MLAVFDDRSILRKALLFEAELARAQSEVGLIPGEVAQRIIQTCASIEIDSDALAEEVAHAGTLAIPLVARLRAALGDSPAASEAVHLGATSQDLADTVLVLQAKEATALLTKDITRLTDALANLAERHSSTPAIGRTLLQDALPITFGLRAAQWLAGVANSRRFLDQMTTEALFLQLGGAVGTRAGLKGRGGDVAARLARALDVGLPPAPWHAQREKIAKLGSAIGILIGVLGKVGRDISLMSQGAVGEAREPLVQGRGGSSAMAHKRNPTASQLAISAALRAPGLVASLLAGMPQEQERGVGGWQNDAAVLAELFMLAGGSADALVTVIAGLEVDEDALGRNLAAAHVGDDIGEAEAIVAAIIKDYRKGG